MLWWESLEIKYFFLLPSHSVFFALGDDDFILGLCSECRRIVFLLAEAIDGVSAEILNLQISWQAQYLVRLEADCACSAHCK